MNKRLRTPDQTTGSQDWNSKKKSYYKSVSTGWIPSLDVYRIEY